MGRSGQKGKEASESHNHPPTIKNALMDKCNNIPNADFKCIGKYFSKKDKGSSGTRDIDDCS